MINHEMAAKSGREGECDSAWEMKQSGAILKKNGGVKQGKRGAQAEFAQKCPFMPPPRIPPGTGRSPHSVAR